jgi:serine/threonine protein kinase
MPYTRRLIRSMLLKRNGWTPAEVQSHTSGAITVSVSSRSMGTAPLIDLLQAQVGEMGHRMILLDTGVDGTLCWVRFCTEETVSEQSQGGTLSPRDQTVFRRAVAERGASRSAATAGAPSSREHGSPISARLERAAGAVPHPREESATHVADGANRSRAESPLERYAGELDRQISALFRRHLDLRDHRRDFPWLQGWLGDPFAGVWFVGENPSLGMVERQQGRYGSHATPEQQWSASQGDQLLRQMLVKHGFKQGPETSPGGWRCYLTNVVKEADYTSRWREKTRDLLLKAAETWAPVLRWEVETGRPRLIVAMGKQPMAMLRHLGRCGLIELPRLVGMTHYAYIGQRADGSRGPMHPARVAEYDQEFSDVARIARGDANRTVTAASLPRSGAASASVTETGKLEAVGRPAGDTNRAPRAAGGFASLLLGQRLGDRYRIEALIGRGGMGAVYRATDERLEREVALKVIAAEPADPAAMERMRSRFRREARAAARLRHPNVVAIHDYGTEERLGLDYLVMELLEGEDLAARLARTPVLPLPLGLRILIEASAGVAAGHRAGLVHRDIKPANLFLEQADARENIRVRVLDFGIAQFTEAGDDTLTHLTMFGSGPHSPAYASPEQLRGGRDLMPAADVFSLGVTGFQTLTGSRPFGPAEVPRIAEGREVRVPSAREREPRVSEALDRVLRKAMSLSPGDRYADAGEFASALLHVAGNFELPPTSSVPGTSDRAGAEWLHQVDDSFGNEDAALGIDHSWMEQFPDPVGRAWQPASSTSAAGNRTRLQHVPTVAELEGRVLRLTPEVLREGNPRRPNTHGWLAFEILLRHEGGRMPFDEYRRRLFNPGPEVRALARQIPGEPDAYQDLKHIRHDIRCGRVVVE